MTIPFYSRQEIFNKVCNHAMAQGEQALVEPNSSACGYRTATGLKCFIGDLINDSLYDPKMEGVSVRALFDDFPEVMAQCRLNIDDMGLLSELQLIHDNRDAAEWPEFLRNFATENDLVQPLSIKES